MSLACLASTAFFPPICTYFFGDAGSKPSDFCNGYEPGSILSVCAIKALNSPCTEDANCSSGFCNAGLCAFRPDGIPCNTDAECESGRCDAVSGLCAPVILPSGLLPRKAKARRGRYLESIGRSLCPGSTSGALLSYGGGQSTRSLSGS